MEHDSFRTRSFDIEPATKRVYVVPSANGWDLVRYAELNKAWEVRAVGTVEEAAGLLQPEDDIVLALPIELVLAQRMRLPTTDPSEFGEMVRIQVEKAMPYSPEEMTTDSRIWFPAAVRGQALVKRSTPASSPRNSHACAILPGCAKSPSANAARDARDACSQTATTIAPCFFR